MEMIQYGRDRKVSNFLPSPTLVLRLKQLVVCLVAEKHKEKNTNFVSCSVECQSFYLVVLLPYVMVLCREILLNERIH